MEPPGEAPKAKAPDSDAAEERASALELYQGLLVERQLDPNVMALERMRTYPRFWGGLALLAAALRVVPDLLPPTARIWVWLAAALAGPALLVVPVGAALDQVEVGGRPSVREALGRWAPAVMDALPAALCLGALLGSALALLGILGLFGGGLVFVVAGPFLVVGAGAAWLRYLGERVVFDTPRGTAFGRAVLGFFPFGPAWSRVRPVSGRRSGLTEAVVVGSVMLAFLLLLELLVASSTTPLGYLLLGFLVHAVQATVVMRFLISWTYMVLGHDPERLTLDAPRLAPGTSATRE